MIEPESTSSFQCTSNNKIFILYFSKNFCPSLTHNTNLIIGHFRSDFQSYLFLECHLRNKLAYFFYNIGQKDRQLRDQQNYNDGNKRHLVDILLELWNCLSDEIFSKNHLYPMSIMIAKKIISVFWWIGSEKVLI